VVEASGSLLEFLDLIEAPDHEWLGDGDHLECLGGQVTLLGIVLAPLACLDEIPHIGEGGWPVEVVPRGFSHEGPWHRLVPVDDAVDVEV